jgi:hypothetical protein
MTKPRAACPAGRAKAAKSMLSRPCVALPVHACIARLPSLIHLITASGYQINRMRVAST